MADHVLPSSEMETRRALLRKGVMLIEGEVNKAMFDIVAGGLTQLEAVGSPDVELRICSAGGNCHFGLAIHDALKMYKGKKRGVVVEKAHSIATVILQACDERVMVRHAKMLIHYPSIEFSLVVLENKARLEKEIEKLRWILERMLDAYMVRAKVTRTKLIARMKRDDEDKRGTSVSMAAEEALSFGLIDKII
jgi:ATP-dependent Clp protease protease subunit